MANISVFLLTLGGLLLAGAVPQYGQDSGDAPTPSRPSSSFSSFNNAGAPAQNQFSSSSFNGFSSPSGSSSSNGFSSSSGSSFSGGSGGSDLTVQCRFSPDGSGKIRYDCSGANKDAITLKTEHFLELENHGPNSQNLDIEIPNYNLDEFIKAAYKGLGPQEGAKINILLKKPDVTYNAEKDEGQNQQAQQPAVSVNYQPVDKISVHYPSQKQYRNGGGSSGGFNSGASSGGFNSGSSGFNSGTSSGGFNSGSSSFPSSSSSGGSSSSGSGAGAYSRPQRERGHRYYFVRQ